VGQENKPATGDKPAAAEKKPAAEAPKRDMDAAFKKRDTNGDGSISLEEFKAGAKGRHKGRNRFQAP
jgi:hypothetical protein